MIFRKSINILFSKDLITTILVNDFEYLSSYHGYYSPFVNIKIELFTFLMQSGHQRA